MVAGIAHGIMTVAGVITAMFQVFIMMWTQGGECITGNGIGTGTRGTMNALITSDYIGIGIRGTAIDTGNGSRPGACRVIDLDHRHRSRN
jgi:hypothetical protein